MELPIISDDGVNPMMRLRDDSVQCLPLCLTVSSLRFSEVGNIGEPGVDRGMTRVTSRVCARGRDEVVRSASVVSRCGPREAPLKGFSAVGHNNLGKILHATALYLGTSTRQEPGYILWPVSMS
jgi:hypothetical protein